jgi:hypothetical protein
LLSVFSNFKDKKCQVAARHLKKRLQMKKSLVAIGVFSPLIDVRTFGSRQTFLGWNM